MNPVGCCRAAVEAGLLALAMLGCAAAAAAPRPAPASSAASAASAPAGALLQAQGAVVHQPAARLVWARCVEGMRWDGRSCTGAARRVDLAGAQQLAAERRRAEGGDWRLPRVPELQRLASFARRQPAQARLLFPAAPGGPLWTATARVDTRSVNPYNYGNIAAGRSAESSGQDAALFGWAVDAFTGDADSDVPRATHLPVRLVRSGG
ncbi:DUF1566 domain-containing protein [Ideonella sp.]|uniref:Lcl C-terminal domain-containing protein n=1 Tax=Ideonella sp. TaxID=1929293 RepID=UPI0035AF5B09